MYSSSTLVNGFEVLLVAFSLEASAAPGLMEPLCPIRLNKGPLMGQTYGAQPTMKANFFPIHT